MLEGAAATARTTDGAENRVVMLGDSGFVDFSPVYLKYLEGGQIRISGANSTDRHRWKKIARITLPPGTYTFTGLKAAPKTVELQLDYSGEDGHVWLSQWNEDITFELDEERDVELHVKVYAGVTVDAIARPAIYKDE